MTTHLRLSRRHLTLPSAEELFTSLHTVGTDLLASIYNFAPATGVDHSTDAARSHAVRRQFKKNKFFFIPLIVIVLLLLGGLFFAVKNAGNSSRGVAGTADSRIELKKPLATQTINKTFSFPLKDGAGKTVSTIKYTIEAAEMRDEIIVKGQRATSVKGRTFLILPIKITNSYNQSVQINARDYVRLIVNNNTNEKLAPDIHNDPVEVQAISTKQTRVGFPIDDTVSSLVLQVGEINGDKQDITLTLRK